MEGDTDHGLIVRDANDALTGVSMLFVAIQTAADSIVIFWIFPKIDLWASGFFYLGNGRFIGGHSSALDLLHVSFEALFASICLLIAIGVMISFGKRGSWLTLPFNKWLFLAACLAIGPGLIVNVALNDHWGRAQPQDVTDFGGIKKFSSAVVPSDQCERDCSFVASEASSIFMIFFAAAFIFHTHARILVAIGIILGGITGVGHVAEGTHFLSDVLFAAILMALTAASVRLLFDRIWHGPRCG